MVWENRELNPYIERKENVSPKYGESYWLGFPKGGIEGVNAIYVGFNGKSHFFLTHTYLDNNRHVPFLEVYKTPDADCMRVHYSGYDHGSLDPSIDVVFMGASDKQDKRVFDTYWGLRRELKKKETELLEDKIRLLSKHTRSPFLDFSRSPVLNFLKTYFGKNP